MLKNLIFDFGGVIIKIDYNQTKTAFERLGAKNVTHYFSQQQQVELFDRFDRGTISPKQFRHKFNELFNLNLSDGEFNNAWNAMLLDIPKSNIDFLMRLKEKYNIFLLSNTNAIHIDAINNYLNKTYQINDWKNYFNKVYYSFEMGMRKPDKEIFEKVITDNTLELSDTLYIEDHEKNLEAAQAMGLPFYTFPMNADLAEELGFLLKVKI